MSRIDKQLRGLAFLDIDWGPTQISDADSTYTEANPRPGASTTQDVLARSEPQVVGAQSVPVSFIGTRAGGFPGIGRDGGGVAYYLDGEAEAAARHHRPPILITDCYSPATQSASSTCAAFPLTGRVLAAWVDDTTATAAYLWEPTTQAWTAVSATPAATGALAVIPGTERALWVSEDGLAWYSDDYGTTWVQYADFEALTPDDGTYDYTGTSRHLAFDGQGQMVWLGKRSGASLYDFYVSSDLGLTWASSATLTTAKASMSAHPDGKIAVAYLSAIGSNIEVFMMGSADDAPDLAVTTTVNTDSNNDVAVVCDEDGTIWLYRTFDDGLSTHKGIKYHASYDTGVSWEAGADTYNWAVTEDMVDTSGGGEPQGLSACASMGHVFLTHGTGHTGGAAATEHFDCVLTLGGWQGAYHEAEFATTTAGERRARAPHERLSGGGAVIPVVSPNPRSLLWYATAQASGIGGSNLVLSSALGTETFSEGGMSFAVTASGHHRYSQTLLGAVTTADGDDCLFRYKIRVVDDGGGDYIAVEVQGNTRDFWIFHRDDHFYVYDWQTGVQIGADIAHTANVALQMEVHCDDDTGVVTVLHKEVGTFGTDWTKTERTLTGTKAAVNWVYYRFGVPASSTSDSEAIWYYFNGYGRFNKAYLPPAPLLEGRNGWGKAISGAHPYPVPDLYDTNTTRAARLAMRGGPLMRSETYAHDVAPDYPVEALFPDIEPSPYTPWRSVDKSASIDIAADVSSVNALVAGAHSWLILVHKANVRRVRVDAKTSAGAYTTLGTVDLATGFDACSFSRVGRVLRPDNPYTGTAGARYLQPGELRGGHVILDPAGSPALRKIVSNTGGWWNGTAGAVQARITLAGVDNSEPSSGTVIIVSPSGVMALHRTATTPEVSRFRFTVDNTADDATETYYEAGVIAPFGLHPTGKQWADGWEWDKTPNVRINADTTRTERRSSLGPTQRSLTLSWDDGFLLGHIRGQAAPNYVADATADFPLATRDEVWGAAWEWMELSDSFARPVLWCGAVPADGVTVTDPTLWLYGYLTPQGVRAKQATGDEGVNEFMRASGITLVEGV